MLVNHAQTMETLQCLLERNAATSIDREHLQEALAAAGRLQAKLRQVYRALSEQSQTKLF